MHVLLITLNKGRYAFRSNLVLACASYLKCENREWSTRKLNKSYWMWTRDVSSESIKTFIIVCYSAEAKDSHLEHVSYPLLL